MDENGRQIITYNRFFSTREIVRSNENYSERNNFDFGNPSNSNEWRQGRSSTNPTIDGGTSHSGQYFGRNIPMSATESRQFQSLNNPTVYEGPNNPTIYEGPNNQYDRYEGRTNYDFGGPVTRNEPRQLQSNINPVIYGGLNSQYNRYKGRTNYDSDKNRNELFPQLQSSNDLLFDGTAKEVSVGNPENEQLSDATSKIEHGKLKKRIIDAYKDKALKLFSENSAHFDKDEWLKVWYVGSDGLRMYQSKMICPLCFKNVTPQNRAESGNLPRWDLNGVKGHLERLHTENKLVGKAVKEKESNEKTAEEKAQNTNEDIPSVEKNFEPLIKSSDSTSPPESPRRSSSSSSDISSESSSELSSETSSESSDVDQAPVSTSKKRRRSSGTKKPPRSTRKREKLLSKSEIPDWRKPGVEFGWVKFTTSSRFLPAFIFPSENNKEKRLAKQILSKGGKLDDKKHEVQTVASESQVEQAKKSKKSKPYLAAIKQFNLINNTKFE